MDRQKILVIEDNADTRRFLEAVLAKEYDVITAENGVIGIEYARNKAPDLVILDIMMPILSGYDVCSLLKNDEKTSQIPIIFLSAKNTTANIAQGLTTGADDYVAKPFDYKELLARIQARLRTRYSEILKPIVLGGLKIDQASREVTYEGKRSQLTLTEFDLLRFLARHAGNVVSREDILKGVWGSDVPESNDRIIDVHIRSLRRKIPDLTRHVRSIYGVGYKYEL